MSPVGAILVGIGGGVLCSLAIGLKYRLGYDDPLDVVAVHLVGGLWGTIAIGYLATAAAPAGIDGLLFGGGIDQLWRQVVGAIAVALDRLMGLRVDDEHEDAGLDASVHAEQGYELGGMTTSA